MPQMPEILQQINVRAQNTAPVSGTDINKTVSPGGLHLEASAAKVNDGIYAKNGLPEMNSVSREMKVDAPFIGHVLTVPCEVMQKHQHLNAELLTTIKNDLKSAGDLFFGSVDFGKMALTRRSQLRQEIIRMGHKFATMFEADYRTAMNGKTEKEIKGLYSEGYKKVAHSVKENLFNASKNHLKQLKGWANTDLPKHRAAMNDIETEDRFDLARQKGAFAALWEDEFSRQFDAAFDRHAARFSDNPVTFERLMEESALDGTARRFHLEGSGHDMASANFALMSEKLADALKGKIRALRMALPPMEAAAPPAAPKAAESAEAAAAPAQTPDVQPPASPSKAASATAACKQFQSSNYSARKMAEFKYADQHGLEYRDLRYVSAQFASNADLSFKDAYQQAIGRGETESDALKTACKQANAETIELFKKSDDPERQKYVQFIEQCEVKFEDVKALHMDHTHISIRYQYQALPVAEKQDGVQQMPAVAPMPAEDVQPATPETTQTAQNTDAPARTATAPIENRDAASSQKTGADKAGLFSKTGRGMRSKVRKLERFINKKMRGRKTGIHLNPAYVTPGMLAQGKKAGVPANEVKAAPNKEAKKSARPISSLLFSRKQTSARSLVNRALGRHSGSADLPTLDNVAPKGKNPESNVPGMQWFKTNQVVENSDKQAEKNVKLRSIIYTSDEGRYKD